jgi:hypothetical protein
MHDLIGCYHQHLICTPPFSVAAISVYIPRPHTQIHALEASVAAMTAAVATQTKRAEAAEDMVKTYRTRGGEANLAIKDKDVCGIPIRSCRYTVAMFPLQYKNVLKVPHAGQTSGRH